MINVFQPTLGDEELAAVGRVFQSNWIGRGKETSLFETEFAAHLSSEPRRVTSVVNCTEGLFHICANIGVQTGDEIILPAVSFVGAANAVVSAGAKAVFCDVDPRTLNARASDIEAAITPRSRAVLIIHYGGVPDDMEAIRDLARDKGLYLIEDCACSVSSRFRGQACGTFGDAAAWSFDAMKILVAGDGSMIWLRDPAAMSRLKGSIYLGLDSESGFTSASTTRWWEFSISQFGRRATMNDISSTIGRVQLSRLPSFIKRRQQIWEFYQERFASLGWLETAPVIPDHIQSSYYLHWIQTDSERRDRLAAYLKENGVYTTFRYYPLHRVAHYGSDAVLPGADRAADTTLNLPLHQALDDDAVQRVVDLIRGFE